MKELIYNSILSKNFITQVICLIIIVLILGFMLFTKPKQSNLYSVLLTGLTFSIFSILIQLFMSVVVKAFGPEKMIYSKMFWALFLLCYCIVLDTIYSYMDILSHITETISKRRITIVVLFNLLYIFFTSRSLNSSDFIVIQGSDVFFADHAYTYVYFGVLCGVLCLINSLIYRNNLPRTIYHYSVLFTILDILILIAQLHFKDVIFSGLTYTLPYLIFYIMFHSNPIDENSGVRNELSFENEYHNKIKRKKQFTLINIYLPYLRNESLQNKQEFYLIASSICRSIEKIDDSIHIYARSKYSYFIFMNDMPKGKIDNVVLQIQNIINYYACYEYIKRALTHKIIVSKKSDYLNSIERYNNFLSYIIRYNFKDNGENEMYIADESDYQKFGEYYEVYEALFDIRNSGNLNDERILCFAQPIYEISSGKFKTAEALMRMKINGKMIFPDVFIPIAEENNFIHILTCTIINKVCIAINEFNKEYDFDAITINASTIEFDDLNFTNEVLEIINKNGVDPSKIRIEITESNMIDSYKNILANMNKMRESGIFCYLDDFGTGYSNFERIFGCPFRTVKFDKSIFYKSLVDSAMDDILRSSINAFKKKGFSVLVEGIENEEQRNLSIEKGFEYIQGYYYSKPLPIEEMCSFFSRKNVSSQ